MIRAMASAEDLPRERREKRTMIAAAPRPSPRLLFLALLCPFRALGLSNVAPNSGRPTGGPRAVRSRLVGGTSLFTVPEATTTDAPSEQREIATTPGASRTAADDSISEGAAAEESATTASRRDAPRITSENGASGERNDRNPSPREGIWMPPSQNVAQRKNGRIFSIQQPQDLLDFVIEDERLSVVKVFASWCKTCQVFDLRYRKLASQLGDKYDAKTGTQITRKGRVRFAEMQFDDPNNEEMCKLLNATLLPYVFIYKGSKGKLREFQCGPAKFQMLIDAVNELADSVVEENVIAGDDGRIDGDSETQPVLKGDESAAASHGGNVTMSAPSYAEDAIDALEQKLITLEEEKLEMFEIMKAQIEHDKVYIQKLEAGVTTQRSMLEERDEEISNMTTAMQQQQSLIEAKEEETQNLTTNLDRQRRESRQAREELSIYKSQVSQLTDRISKIENTILSLEQLSSIHETSARKNQVELTRQIEEWETEKAAYEEERSSLRKLAVLGVKRVGRGMRNLFARIRRKKID